jgi:hypothetical protein
VQPAQSLQVLVESLAAGLLVKRRRCTRPVVPRQAIEHSDKMFEVLVGMPSEMVCRSELKRVPPSTSIAVLLGQDQSELGQVAALGRLGLQHRVMALGFDLCEDHGIDRGQAQVLVGSVEVLEISIQPKQARPLIPGPLFVRDLDPKQAADGILEGAQVAGVHGVNTQVIQYHTWAPKQGRGLHCFSSTSLQVRLVGDQGSTVQGLWSEIVEAHVAFGQGRIAHPAKEVGVEVPQPKALDDPFPITSHLQQSCWRKGCATRHPADTVMLRPCTGVVASARRPAIQQALQTPGHNPPQQLESVVATAPTSTQATFPENKQRLPLVSSLCVP